MSARFGKWFRCRDDEHEQTIAECLAAIACFEIVKKPAAMHVDLFNCTTSKEFNTWQPNMQLKRDAYRSLPTLHQSKRRRCDAGETSADPSVLSPLAPLGDELTNVLAATPVMPIRSLRTRVGADITKDSQLYAPVKLPFEMCIAIILFLASPSAPEMLHRVIGGGPVT